MLLTWKPWKWWKKEFLNFPFPADFFNFFLYFSQKSHKSGNSFPCNSIIRAHFYYLSTDPFRKNHLHLAHLSFFPTTHQQQQSWSYFRSRRPHANASSSRFSGSSAWNFSRQLTLLIVLILISLTCKLASGVIPSFNTNCPQSLFLFKSIWTQKFDQ